MPAVNAGTIGEAVTVFGVGVALGVVITTGVYDRAFKEVCTFFNKMLAFCCE